MTQPPHCGYCQATIVYLNWKYSRTRAITLVKKNPNAGKIKIETQHTKMQRTKPQHPVKHVPVIYAQANKVTAGKYAANVKLTPTANGV